MFKNYLKLVDLSIQSSHRITYTNQSGKVFEFSYKQIQEWCKQRGLQEVPELFYGSVESFCNINKIPTNNNDLFLKKLQELYLEKNCYKELPRKPRMFASGMNWQNNLKILDKF